MDKKQMAVEWLVDQLEKHYVFQDIKNTTAFLQAKEMETEQNDKPLDEKLFNLANEFAVAGYGDVAVRLHYIHTNL